MKRIKRPLFIAVVVIVILAALAYIFRGNLERWFFEPTESNVEQGITNQQNGQDEIAIVANDLVIPWEVAFLPNGDTLISERSGTIQRIGQGSHVHAISGVQHIGEGGLLGMALHPDFSQNNWLYIYFTTEQNGQLSNKIVRYELTNDALSNARDIITGIPAATNHDGGRIAFGPDGYLYVGTGDAGNEDLAQNTDSLAGKILRLQSDGNVAPDNPFNNAVYSYGHRNVQGLAWDDQGRLWATEHGPSGLQSGYDELNRIAKGANYGWPIIKGDETQNGMETPVRHSGANDTWAPAGLAYADGSLFFAGLRGQALYQARIIEGGGVVNLKAHFKNEYGRLRAVVAHDNSLYITTSNTDGRGNPRPNDDKLIRLSTSLFD